MMSMMLLCMEYPFGQLDSAVLAVSYPILFIPSLLAGRGVSEAEKALTLCKHCSAITANSMYYQHYLQNKSKIQPPTSYYEEY